MLEEYAGHIELIMGPMFSGKSTELLRRMRRYECAKLRCLVIKYSGDTRYSVECMATHDRQTMPAFASKVLSDVPDLDNYDCIGIDEGQFFPDLKAFCEDAANKGKVIIVAALDGNFKREKFGSVCELIPLAEDVIKLTAVCMQCQRPASFSKRITKETREELIGGSDMYVSVCRSCYFSEERCTTPTKNISESEIAGTPSPSPKTDAGSASTRTSPVSFGISRATFCI